MHRGTAMASRLWLGAVLLALSSSLAAANERRHQYVDKEPVILWVNKVGPYSNPQETYNYYYLPFCKAKPGQKLEHSWGGLGEVLQGNELINSQLLINFKETVPGKQPICSQTLTDHKAMVFQQAIAKQYWFEMFLDDLPVWGFVGTTAASLTPGQPEQQFIYTHQSFNISYNQDRIIHVNLTNGEPVLVQPGTVLSFTYSVHWYATDIPFRQRFQRYLDGSFFEHKVHWFAVVNSFLMVLFLTGLVAIILMRTLRKDYSKYAKLAGAGDLEALDMDNDSGWRAVHGDVFRQPQKLMLLSAAVGTGCQLALLCVVVLGLAILGSYFEERGTILTSFLICYALTSVLGGYVSGSMFAKEGGRRWIPNMLLTAGMFPGICFGIALALNMVAVGYHSLAAVPFGYIVAVLLLWGFISFPLCLVGTLLGRNWNGAPDHPCRVKRIPSPIPHRPWYLQPSSIMLAGGLLPFGSVFVELHFVFSSFFAYKVYYVYPLLLLVTCILMLVTACVTIVGTYALLNAEVWHWQWTSFGMAACTSLYVAIWSVLYFHRTKMSGLLQTAFFAGYSAMFCCGMGLMLGAVGYMAASHFVRKIYRNVKAD